MWPLALPCGWTRARPLTRQWRNAWQLWSILVLGTIYVSGSFLKGLIGDIMAGRTTTRSRAEAAAKGQ